GGAVGGLLRFDGGSGGGEDDDPQKKLEQTGTIPPDFLRQMFYTLGDYRDILFSGDKGEKNGYNYIFSGDKEIAQREEKIKEKITKFFEQNGTHPPKPGTHSPSSGTTPEDWWKNHGEHIWNAMVCALTYNTDTASGQTPKQIDEVKNALLDDSGKKPTDNYKYDQVKLDENSETQAKDTKSQASGEKITLDSFIKRPPYFRYLEEWGETFCKERKKRLEKIKDDCYKDDGSEKQYSGDGEDCLGNLPDDPTTFKDLEGSSCSISCRSYKKWIERKKEEFIKQSNVYEEQKQNCGKESAVAKSNDNGFCRTLKDDAAQFLERLKNGPCKNNENVEVKKGEDDINFKENDSKTFKHTNLCDPCSQFKIDCRNGNCKSAVGEECNGKNKTITANDIKDKKDANGNIEMRVSDKSGKEFKDLDACRGAGIFKRIRKDEWKCGKVCGYVVCKLEKVNGEIVTKEKVNEKHIIQIRALIKRWLEYLFEDYNRIRKKLNHCMNSSEQTICTNGCVEQWINLKKQEWQQIKKLFNEQYNGDDTEMKSSFRSFLVDLIRQIAATIDKGNHKRLQKLVKSVKCKCAENSKKNNDNQDAIDCMINKLQEKIKTESCPTPTSGET
ncbi:hypothetical protein PFTANZ_06187, partial [Plasmodium falciparum Tanzania (2000708)]